VVFLVVSREVFSRAGDNRIWLPAINLPKWRWKEYFPKPLSVRDPRYEELYKDYVEKWDPIGGLRWLTRKGLVPVQYRRVVRELLEEGTHYDR